MSYNMPDEIWAWTPYDDCGHGYFLTTNTVNRKHAKYVRADTVQKPIKNKDMADYRASKKQEIADKDRAEALEFCDMLEGLYTEENDEWDDTQKTIETIRAALQAPAVVPDVEKLRAEYNRVIEFAIEQGPEADTFLRSWSEGDTSEWPEFAAAPTPEERD